jgi:hypothetical protein
VVDRRSDHAGCTVDVTAVVTVRNRRSPAGTNLGHDFFGRRNVNTVTLQRRADIVDDNLCAFGGERKCVGATKPTTCSGNDDHTTIDNSHDNSSIDTVKSTNN